MSETADLFERLLDQPEFARKTRLPSLFSDFSPLKNSNKDGYEANIAAWIKALNQITLNTESVHGDRLSIKADAQLAESLGSPQWGRPLALAAVEREARARKVWVQREAYLGSTESIYHLPGLFDSLSIGSVLRWGVSKVYSPSPSNVLSGAVYVSIPNLEHVASTVMASVESEMGAQYSGHITTVPLFRDWIHERTRYALTDSDMHLLLCFLQRDHENRVTRSKDVVKIFDKSSLMNPISETDLAIAHLKSTHATVTRQMDTLTSRIIETNSALKSALSHKSRALSLLRTKKLLETTLSQRQETEVQISTILIKIDDAVSNVGAIEAMAAGGRALKDILSSIGGVERVDDVMDQVKTQMELGDEVGRVMGEQGPMDDEREEEVEAAWLEMIKEQTEAQASIDASKSKTELAIDNVDGETRKQSVRTEEQGMQTDEIEEAKEKETNREPERQAVLA